MVTADEKFTQAMESNIFLDGPTQHLVRKVVEFMKTVPQWVQILGDRMDVYERVDYSFRALPAIRVYNLDFRKEHESHYIFGEIHVDFILPPSLRRSELQLLQDALSSAMIQQFRRPSFFDAIRDAVPGLNELGKMFGVDKSLAVKFDEGICPLLKMTPNFRLDLKVWDEYLQREARTKDDPFVKTLCDLETIVTTIQGKNDDLEETNVEIGIEQSVRGD